MPAVFNFIYLLFIQGETTAYNIVQYYGSGNGNTEPITESHNKY